MNDFRFKRKPFVMVERGDKTLEARINYPFVKKVNVNEVVLFFWEQYKVKVRIIAIRRYNSFKEMLDHEDVKKLVPGMSKEDALAEYQKIYPAEKVKKYGGVSIFAFEIVD